MPSAAEASRDCPRPGNIPAGEPSRSLAFARDGNKGGLRRVALMNKSGAPVIAGIILAAGSSSRMGQPKQLLNWSGAPLIRLVAEYALASQLNRVFVVVGAAAEQVTAALDG